MSEHHEDQTLTGDTHGLAGTDLTDGPDLTLAAVDAPLTIDQVLDMARLPERTASVCVRPDLQSTFERITSELSRLVTVTGDVVDDEDSTVGQKSNTTRAHELNEQLQAVRREMAGFMMTVRFRAMSSDDWASFTKRHQPKEGAKAEATMEFHNRLVCETAVEPEISMDQILRLRKVLSPVAVGTFVKTAWEACTVGGIDVPKLPAYSRNLAAESSDD